MVSIRKGKKGVFCFPSVPPEPLSMKNPKQDGKEGGSGNEGERDINPQLCDDVLRQLTFLNLYF